MSLQSLMPNVIIHGHDHTERLSKLNARCSTHTDIFFLFLHVLAPLHMVWSALCVSLSHSTPQIMSPTSRPCLRQHSLIYINQSVKTCSAGIWLWWKIIESCAGVLSPQSRSQSCFGILGIYRTPTCYMGVIILQLMSHMRELLRATLL